MPRDYGGELMKLDEYLKTLKLEVERAERDAEMSTLEDDLAYHNGETDGLNWAIYHLEKLLEELKAVK
jgi:hypothetical protein